ncbi:transketolase family protein [Candidatus Pacearchaeota archaeon]|nr:transketolase family protein [Candidatus Pacearchaeota archaeon]
MSKIAQRTAFGESLIEAGEKYNDLLVVDADLGGATKVSTFAQKFPERSFNVGIAEQNGISVATGMAFNGYRPFMASFGVFSASRSDQIRIAAYSEAPIVIVGTHIGLTGKDGATHQALEDIGLLSSLPNMNIFQPTDCVETREIVKYLAGGEGRDMLAYLRLSRHPQRDVFDEDHKFMFNKAATLNSTKNPQGVVFTTGDIALKVLDATTALSKKNYPLDVLSFSTLKPIDKEAIINYAEKGMPIITVEEHNPTGGLGSRVCEVVAERGLPSKVLRLGVDGFGGSGDPADLYRKFGLDAQGIADSVENFIYD